MLVMRRGSILTVVLLCAATALADSWSLPRRETYLSADATWRLVVTPKQLQGQREYFRDKVERVPDAGAAPGVQGNEARADLFHKAIGTTWKHVARWSLVNEVSPVDALVANDGTVVTFDNWHLMGYGDDVVVIYGPDGKLRRKLGLSDLLFEEDIGELNRSTSSIWWSGTHRIDEANRVLLLEIQAQKLETLPLSLDTGEMLEPKREVFARRVTWSGDDLAGGCEGAIGLSRSDLEARAVTAEVPAYPEVARKARTGGVVILEIVIGPTGAVEEARILKPLPFGLDVAAQKSVATWRFRPMERNGTPVSMCGHVRMNFEPRTAGSN